MSMILRRSFLSACLGVIAGSVLAGCFGAGSSKLEANEPVDIGRREFDKYFEQVDELRDRIEGLDSDLFPVRQRLVEEMNLDVDVAIGDLLEETRKRVMKAKDYGTAVSLQLTPTAKVHTDRGDLEASDKDENLFTAIEQSAERAMDKFKEYSELLEASSALDRKRSDLANKIDKLPKQFESKKSLIETEIVAAGRVLRNGEDVLLRDTRTLSHFLVGLVEAVNTGALDASTAKCDEAIAFFEEAKKKPKPKPRPRWRGRPAGAPRPRPQPAGGDFEM